MRVITQFVRFFVTTLFLCLRVAWMTRATPKASAAPTTSERPRPKPPAVVPALEVARLLEMQETVLLLAHAAQMVSAQPGRTIEECVDAILSGVAHELEREKLRQRYPHMGAEFRQ